ncbi:MAG: hypothetical protein ACKO2G_00375 [Verrucomicrobiales bacterium]
MNAPSFRSAKRVIPVLLASWIAFPTGLSAAPVAHDPAALDVLKAVQAKLAGSPSFTVTAKRAYSLRGGKTEEPISVTAQRPNRFLAHQGKADS